MSRPELHLPFLERVGWGGAQVAPLADDASFRSYHRISAESGAMNRGAVLMDAPPPEENVRPFMALSRYLCKRDLSAPHILAADKREGFLLLEDMGDNTFNRVLARAPDCEAELYEAAIDVLLHLHLEPPPKRLAIDGNEELPIDAYDMETLLFEVSLFADWYLPLTGGPANSDAAKELTNLFAPLISPVVAARHVLTLRDYHADNLMLLAGREGIARVGLLDFQDALRGHPAYDLVSLLKDARRDVPTHLEEAMIRCYIDGNPGTIDDEEDFRAAYAVLGAARNAKIIGIFSRLCQRDQKPGYLQMIPRVWGLLERALEHPALAELKVWFDHQAPPDLRKIPPEAAK